MGEETKGEFLEICLSINQAVPHCNNEEHSVTVRSEIFGGRRFTFSDCASSLSTPLLEPIKAIPG